MAYFVAIRHTDFRTAGMHYTPDILNLEDIDPCGFGYIVCHTDHRLPSLGTLASMINYDAFPSLLHETLD